MRKTGFVLVLMIFVGMTYAQNRVIGVWQLAEMTYGGETVKVHSMHVDFNLDGKLYISGREFGSWKQNANNLETKAEMQLDIINGNNIIIKLSDEALVLENEENGIQTFKRASLPSGKEYKNKIVGEYMLTKIKEKGKEVKFGTSIVNFKSDGTFYIQKMFFGKWRFEKKTKKLNITTIEKEDFNGDNIIIKLGEKLVFKTETGNTLFFEKLDWNKISENNKMSGLIGLWEIEASFNEMISEGGVEEVTEKAIEEVVEEVVEEAPIEEAVEEITEEAVEEITEEIVEEVTEEIVEEVTEEIVEEVTEEGESQEYYENFNSQNDRETNYLLFNSENIYRNTQGNSSSTGMWVFKKNKTITFIGRYIGFGGENKIIEINDNKFVFSNKDGQIFTATKTEQDAKNLEYINFNEEEYFHITENSKSPKLEIDNSKIPWGDYYSNVEYLKSIKAIEYTCYKPIEYIEVFEKTKRTISVEYSNEENAILIDDLFSSSSYAEKIKYGENYYGQIANHPYIVIEDILTGKVMGQEKISTPAGTFECTVIEGYYDYEKKIKIWMINNKPGVYAKIINSEKDIRGITYSLFILNRIIE